MGEGEVPEGTPEKRVPFGTPSREKYSYGAINPGSHRLIAGIKVIKSNEITMHR